MNFTKDPAARLDWRFDWSDWLAAGETITESAFTVTGTLQVDVSSHNGAKATVWITGGTAGKAGTVTHQVTTDQGRIDRRSVRVHVRRR